MTNGQNRVNRKHDFSLVGFLTNHGAGLERAMGMGVSGESAGPGDVAMADGVDGIAAFGKNPASAGVDFAQGVKIGSNVWFGFGEAFFGHGELVHEGEAEVVLF